MTLQRQVLDYIADTQPPGRATAACVPTNHSEEQRRIRERAREGGHNEHIASTVKGPLLLPSLE